MSCRGSKKRGPPRETCSSADGRGGLRRAAAPWTENPMPSPSGTPGSSDSASFQLPRHLIDAINRSKSVPLEVVIVAEVNAKVDADVLGPSHGILESEEFQRKQSFDKRDIRAAVKSHPIMSCCVSMLTDGLLTNDSLTLSGTPPCATRRSVGAPVRWGGCLRSSKLSWGLSPQSRLIK